MSKQYQALLTAIPKVEYIIQEDRILAPYALELVESSDTSEWHWLTNKNNASVIPKTHERALYSGLQAIANEVIGQKPIFPEDITYALEEYDLAVLVHPLSPIPRQVIELGSHGVYLDIETREFSS